MSMLTRTHPLPSSETSEHTESPAFIEEMVDERGFYLYEWISPEELRMSVQSDYLSIIRAGSTPLAIVTLIAGFIGLSGGTFGVLIAVLGILTFFYICVLIALIVKMIRKSYLYTRGGNVVITDDYYVSAGKVVKRSDFSAQKSAFESLEKTFREPLLEPSGLAEHIEMQKESLIDQLKGIASGGGKLVQNLGRSRDAGGIVLVLMITGILYGAMMAGVYFIGVFFVSILARVFSWIAHRTLLAMNNTEHEIQTLFSKIYGSSLELKDAKKNALALLTEAGRNEWVENLSSRMGESFELIGEMAGRSTDDTVKLRNILKSSKYKDIFNFVKYGNWVKSQVITPIDEIYDLLTTHKKKLEKTLSDLSDQIKKTTAPSLEKPLILQCERIKIQLESFDRVMKMLEVYREKLKI